MSAADWIDANFSARSFAIGMGGVALVCAGLAGWAVFKGNDALSTRINAMPGQTVAIAWNTAPLTQPIKPPNFVAVDVPVTPPSATPPPETTEPEAASHDTAAVPHTTGTTAVTLTESVAPTTPLDGLFETTQWGKLPIIRKADGMTPFQAYRRPFDRNAAATKPIISLAVFDMGLSDSATNAAMRALPPDVSLVLSPYMTTPDLWVVEARSRGHEIWLSLPVQGKDYPLVDPGPQTMLIGDSEKDNLNKLYWTMSRATNYAGFITPPDPTFLKAEQDMRPVLTRIYGRGLGFIDGSMMPPLIPQTMAKSMKAPYGTIDVWVDSPAEKESITDAQ
ncbi:MAG: divergent polysaccharide deacetylase family protein, partial [Alphaproteobacteria bacterium]|nr:divergent polysaccharide deacetylase family protein [Alphaproteobacteria bacterium]